VPDADARIDVRIESDTVWLTQRQMGDLFDTSSDNIGLHLKNIYTEQELNEKATTEDFSIVQTEGAPEGQARHQALRFGRNHLCRIPRQLKARLSLSPMGH
jgi:hypothetical protein